MPDTHAETTLEVDGRRGTTGRLSPIKAFFVNAAALFLIGLGTLAALGAAVAIVMVVTR